jgi:AraC family transcriptional activator of pobA
MGTPTPFSRIAAPAFAPVPVFKLYGEHEHWPTPDMVHCESIAARSRLHNWQIRPHQHNGLFQILYLQEGTASVRLEDRQSRMHAGQILVVPQMCVHGFKFNRDAVGHVITLAYPLINRLTRQAGDGLLALTSPSIHTLSPENGEGRGAMDSSHLRTTFAALDAEYRGSGPYRHLLLESLLAAILVWLARDALAGTRGTPGPGRRAGIKEGIDAGANAGAEAKREAGRGAEHFSRFCELIEEHYTAHHPVTFYAGKVGITAAHLNVICRQAAGKSALELVHERILLEAKRCLVYTSMTVSMVSDTLGFSDPAYFTRFFKRAAGISPKDFRRQAGT